MLALRANYEYLRSLQLPTSFLMMSRESERDSSKWRNVFFMFSCMILNREEMELPYILLFKV
jgi:hypothetical protein